LRPSLRGSFQRSPSPQASWLQQSPQARRTMVDAAVSADGPQPRNLTSRVIETPICLSLHTYAPSCTPTKEMSGFSESQRHRLPSISHAIHQPCHPSAMPSQDYSEDGVNRMTRQTLEGRSNAANQELHPGSSIPPVATYVSHTYRIRIAYVSTAVLCHVHAE